MNSRKGKSLDYTEEKRKKIWDTYHEMKDEYSMTDIAHHLEMSAVNFYHIRRTRWWEELEANEDDEK